jgi:hypothetical protein
MAENAVAQQLTGCAVPRKCLAELLSRPLGRRMCGDGEVNDTSAVVRRHPETHRGPKPDRRHGKEVNRYEALEVVIGERPPCLGKRLPTAHQVFAYAGLPDIDTKLEQFAVNGRRTQPGFSLLMRRIRSPNLGWDRRAPDLAALNLPRPEEAERLSLPANDSVRLDDDQRRTPIRPHAGTAKTHKSRSTACNRGRYSRSVEERRSDAGVQHSPAAA